MFSHFFIRRPIFAAVLSIVITLAGAVSVLNLPLAQYPQITPPSIMVMCNYPGADAQVVADTVAAPIEQQINGVEDMMYMVSQSNNDGSYTLTVTFKPGVNLNFAQVLVQNRINLALPLLPDVVKQAGVTTRKRNPDILQVIAIYSPHGRYDQLYLSNFCTIKIKDEIARVDGVGDCQQFGQQDYSMRLWLDPDRLASLNLTAADVTNALREQNRQVAAGHIGQQPTAVGAPFEYTLTTVGRLSEPSEFEEIVIRTDAEGRKVRLKDVGRATLGARNLDSTSKVDGLANASLAVFSLPDANALATAQRVIARMEELKKSFPEDIEYTISLDMTPFIRESIHEVIRTLVEAIVLVAIVVLVFLQNWRSALIPLVAVPVAIVGTFALMAAIGFSLNTLTLFGLVLAIGIVVDDAIVVVEAVEHHIEEGMTPRQAAHQAMNEVSGPVIAVALVLSAVFVPCAFITGITGQFFRQFALTIAVSTVISAFNSLTLSPALAAILLPPRGAKRDLLGRFLDFVLGWFFRLFNASFRRATAAYTGAVGRLLRGSAVVLTVYGGLLLLTWWTSSQLPSGYIPNQDQGRFYIAVQLPDAASMERTQQVTDQIQQLVQPLAGVAHTTEIAGQSFTLNANGSNFGQFFVSFEDFDKRPDPSLSADALTARVRDLLAKEIPDAMTSIFTPPPVSGLGSASGFKIIIEDRGDLGFPMLQKQIEQLIAASKKSDKVENLFSVFRANVPRLYMDLNRDQCQSLGVNPADVFSTLQIYLGSYYVNDFNRFGRTWQVVAQAGGEFRDQTDKIKLLKVRNADGEMVPLGAVLDIKEVGGPINIGRYNMYPACAILGATKPGVSTGEGIEEMERLCREMLIPGMAFEWTEINYMQIDAAKNIGNNLIFPLAVVFVFLVLAAQYESWALPLAVILVVPMCILGSLTGVFVTHGDINIFTQIGFVVLVGLASKNAILIVEFAKHKREDAGLSRTEATLEACKLRLRPILMTSFAFILGVVPLLLGHGAGAEMRRVLGVAVFSGMLGVTIFGIFLTPVFFYVIEGLIETPLFAAARWGWLRRLRLRKPLLPKPQAAIAAVLTNGVSRNGTAHRREQQVTGSCDAMFSRFFINRPIFASVLSIVIVLGGSIALFTLPVAQYPEITPPTVEVSASYPGANAQIVADTVAAPIEQQVNGVEGMMYMSSQCTNDGNYTLTVTFKPGSDLNISQVLVQNRESLAEPILPDLVKRRGISVKKKSPNVLMIVNLVSKDTSRTALELSNYATIQIRDELSRLPGVGDITYLGQRDYSMRLWLDPQKMASYGLNAQDVINAVQAQNVQVAAGQIGQPPTPTGQVSQYIITTLGRLENTDQFANIILKNSGSTLVYLRDVASIELGAQSYDQTCTLDGKPSVALSVYQLPGSNALDVARRVKERMSQLRSHFPPGIDYSIVYDTTPFITESIREVFETLFDAIVLVAVVVLVFLQNWRSSLIPLIAVPVAVIGTFAVMAAMGFSLNNLTLFGLVLAIGIVVDDAIVVVEAVEHHIEEGLQPRAATLRAMEQVSGPVVAIGLVLSAVFIPCAFITGIVGQFFRQFALTIAVSTVISAFNSLTLSPALAALLLRPREKGHFEPLPWFTFLPMGAWLGHKMLGGWVVRWWGVTVFHFPSDDLPTWLTVWAPIVFGAAVGVLVGVFLSRPLNRLLGWAFTAFNKSFEFSTNAYTRAVAGLLRVSFFALAVYGGLLVLTWWGLTHTPTGFIPQQDKGYLLVNVQLPDAASVKRTQDVVEKIERIALDTPGVKHTVAIAGQSILLNANASNFGALYLMLDEFEDRTKSTLSAEGIAATLQDRVQKEVPTAVVNIFGAPPVEGLGTAGGFKIVVQDTGDNGFAALQETADKVVAAGAKRPQLDGLFSSFRADTPWLELIVDRTQAKDRGVSIDDIRTTLESTIGPYYVNDFNRFGRTWQVNVQARDVFRETTDDLKQLKVRNAQGEMVPLADFATVKFVSGPVMVTRYNMYPAAAVHADAGPDTSSGQAIAALEETANAELPQTMRTEWTELAFLQLQTGNTAMWVFVLAVVLVFLVLAAQYESWALPLAVILVVPMCLLCAIAGVLMARMDINVFTQVGFLVLVGLACKNAILIVEYAKAQRETGMPTRDATLAAVKLRLRPIIMTSFAFILGVVPLMLSEGAGAEMRRTLGTAVFAGMLGVTIFGIFLTPVFYYVIQWFKDRRGDGEGEEVEDDGRVDAFLSDLDHGLRDLDGAAGHGRRLSPVQVETLERSVSRIQQLLSQTRNGHAVGAEPPDATHRNGHAVRSQGGH